MVGSTSRGSIVVASLDRGLDDSQEGDLMILGAEKVLHNPVKCILAGLGTINTDDNVQHLFGIAWMDWRS